MARKASSKADSGSSSTATIGFKEDSCSFGFCHSGFLIASALTGQVFDSTQIRLCLWFFWKNVTAGKCRPVPGLQLTLAA